ncbi:MAG: PHB depolymerase family esterase [Myxococcota bacterium]
MTCTHIVAAVTALFVSGCAPAEGDPQPSSDGDAGEPGSTGGTTAFGSSGAAQTADGATETGESTGDPRPVVEPEPSEGCGAGGRAASSQTEVAFEYDGQTRTYDLFVPAAYDGTSPLPLVFNFHGLGSNPAEQTGFSQFDTTAEARGFVVAYPAGLDDSWNAGLCCGDSAADGVDDVGFVRALADALATQLCIDRNRIYATGMSNGGFLSQRLGCEASDVFAAIAPVAGVLGLAPEDCTPDRAVPIIHAHGTMDQLVPYEGGGLVGGPSVRESIDGWVTRNGCVPEPAVTFDVDPVVCETWSGCDADGEVVLCTATGVSHCWPGNDFCPFGPSTTALHASEAMADFFERHPMPQ